MIPPRSHIWAVIETATASSEVCEPLPPHSDRLSLFQPCITQRWRIRHLLFTSRRSLPPRRWSVLLPLLPRVPSVC